MRCLNYEKRYRYSVLLQKFDHRNVMVQAILPLRGKILNIERQDEAAMYKNEEIQHLILGLGLGVKVNLFFVPFFFLW